MKQENKDLIIEHIVNAENSENLNDKYLSYWKAFNIMYEIERETMVNGGIAKNPTEAETAKFCARKIDINELPTFLNSQGISRLINIAPVKNIRDLYRKKIENTQKFDTFRALILDDTNTDFQSKLDALVDLLYLVRCNLDHGFKSRDRPRDQEVLAMSVPNLKFVITKLKDIYSI